MYLHLLIAGSVNSNYTLHIWFTLLFRIPFLVRELNANQIYYLHVPAEKKTPRKLETKPRYLSGELESNVYFHFLLVSSLWSEACGGRVAKWLP